MAGIPHGWTREKLQNATVDDLRQLPEEVNISGPDVDKY